jgi:hypothetical protein
VVSSSPLRHHRPGELLELHHELRVLLAPHRAQLVRPVEQEDVAHELEDGATRRRVAADRPADRAVDVLPVAEGEVAGVRVDVGAIDREAGDRLPERVGQAAEREVAEAAVLFGDAVEQVCEDVQLAGQRSAQDELLVTVDQVLHAA